MREEVVGRWLDCMLNNNKNDLGWKLIYANPDVLFALESGNSIHDRVLEGI